MKHHCLLIAALSLAAFPASAEWRATTPEAEEAVKSPRIAAVMEAITRVDAAVLAKDMEAFEAALADDVVVNNPFNRIATRQGVLNAMTSGLIDYTSFTRSIEYAAERGEYEVVLMGEELVTPVGDARFAGQTVKRRTTEIWRNESGSWRLSVRQATIYSVE